MNEPVQTRSLPPAPGFLTSSLRIFDLSIGEMLWSRRTVFMLLIVAAPVLIALFIRALVSLGAPVLNGPGNVRMTGPAIFGMMIWIFYLRFTVPVLGVFYGTSLIADEVEDKTITYLFTRPIPRRAVLLGKYFAYLACTVLLVLPSVMLVFFLIVPTGGGSIGAAFPSLAADLGMLVVGLAAYGAVFALVGTRLKRPLVVGLVFAFGWEPAVLLFPGYLKRVTVAYYTQALVKHEMPQDSAMSVLMQVFQEVPSVPVSLLCLGTIIGLTLWFAGRAVEQREYVLEQ